MPHISMGVESGEIRRCFECLAYEKFHEEAQTAEEMARLEWREKRGLLFKAVPSSTDQAQRAGRTEGTQQQLGQQHQVGGTEGAQQQEEAQVHELHAQQQHQQQQELGADLGVSPQQQQQQQQQQDAGVGWGSGVSTELEQQQKEALVQIKAQINIQVVKAIKIMWDRHKREDCQMQERSRPLTKGQKVKLLLHALVRFLWNKLSTGVRAVYRLDLDKSKLDLIEKEFGYCALIGLCVCSLVVALGELGEAKIKEKSTQGEPPPPPPMEKVPDVIYAFFAFSVLALVFAFLQALTPILSCWRRRN